MPGELSSRGGAIALDGASGRGATARTTYVALLTAAPSDATTLGTMQEVFAAGTNGYSRMAVTWNAPTGDPATTSNSATITFGPFTADPPNITHCALVSAATGATGDFIFFWTLNNARDPASGESAQFAAGALTMTVD